MTLRNLSLYSFISQVIGFSFHFFTAFVLVRLLGKIEFGVYQQYNLLLTTILPFFGFTLVSSLYFFSGNSENEAEKSYFFSQTFFLLILSSLLFSISFFIFKDPILGYLNLGALNEAAIWSIASIAFYLASSICDNIFLLDKNRFGILFFLPLEKITFFTIILSAYFLQERFIDVFKGIFLVSLLKFVFTAFYLAKRHSLSYFSADLKKIKSQISYCWPFYLGTLVYIFSNKIDKYILNGYVEPSDYAIYSVSFLSIPFLANAYSSVNNVALPEFVSLVKHGDFERLRDLYRNMVVKTGSIAVPLLLFFYFYSEFVVQLVFTAEYLEGTLYYKIALLSFLGTLTSYGLILRAANQTRKIFLINLICAAITVLIAFWLVPSQLLLGAAITSVFAVVLPSLIQLYFEVKLTGYSFRVFFPWKQLFKILGISLLIFPIGFGIGLVFQRSFLLPLLSAVIYFPAAFFLLFKLNLLPFRDIAKWFGKR
jgi:lipopolysaccharide exporter